MVPSSPSSPPVTKYAESDGVNIAYRTCGDGPLDLIYGPGLISHIEAVHRSGASGHGSRGDPSPGCVPFPNRFLAVSTARPSFSVPRPGGLRPRTARSLRLPISGPYHH